MQEPEETLFPHAIEHNVGVVIMSATRAEKLLGEEDTPDLAQFYRYVLGHPAVSLSVMGLRSVENFQHVARALSQRVDLRPEERAALEAYGGRVRTEKELFG
jgi:hypothetical protein